VILIIYRAQDKGSSVADIVFQGRDTLFRVEKFIHSTNIEQLSGKQVEKGIASIVPPMSQSI
jgi:hypothetical protein